MSAEGTILMRMFGRPRGVLGRLGGIIMALTKRQVLSQVIDLLDIEPCDQALEIGFGPGVGIHILAERISAGHVRGIDPSSEMVEQATTRNSGAIQRGLVELRLASVESLPFADNTFDKVLAVNSMQVWRDPAAGLRQIRRVIKPAAKVALGFTNISGQPKKGMADNLLAAGFTSVNVVERDRWFCVLALKS
jgi:ubiquinone/menaquinone biosynthesis C-methylase UbiE